MNAAKAIKATLPADVLSNAVLAMYFEAFLSVEYHVLIRFGKWIDILEKDKPTNTEVCVCTCTCECCCNRMCLYVRM